MSDTKKVRKPNTRGLENKREKAKANLAVGRAKRQQMIKERKEQAAQEYDVDTSESDSESDAEDYVLSKKPKAKVTKTQDTDIRIEVNEMKSVLAELVQMQKKHKKPKEKTNTKIVVLQPNNEIKPKKDTAMDSFQERMKKIFN